MNLVLRAMIGLRRWATPNVGFAFAVGGAMLGIEVLGRQSPTDLHDLLSLLVLSMLLMLIYARHRRAQLPGADALTRLAERFLDWIKQATVQMGLDLRGRPPVKRGTPPLVFWSATTLAIFAVALLFTAEWMPHGLRSKVMLVSYLVYLVGLAILWIALFAAILLAAFIPLAIIHDTFVARHQGPKRRSRRGEAIAIGIFFGGLFAGGAALPKWAAPAISFVLTLVYVTGIWPARRFAVQFLWRPRGTVKVRSLSWAQWVTWEFVLIGLLIQTLTLASCGSLLYGDELVASVMPLTTLMGVILAWLGPGLMGMLCVQMVLGRRRDPARPAPPTAHVRDHTGMFPRRMVRRLFARRGWRVRFHPAVPAPGDVQVALVRETPPRVMPAHEWPMVTTLAGLDRDGAFVRLNRRDEIQRRRRFFSGLETLFKLASSKARGGCGYWLGPHFWFIAGLMRDTRPGEDGNEFDLTEDPILTGSVGPPYHRVFPRAVRNHLYHVLRGTEVDLIFVEDGVSFKRLRKVVRVLFEVFDIHAGRRPAEEIDFRGLPGTRVMIHDFQFDEPFTSELYPEPKYEFLGRARILHVFKDRGGQEELIEPPFDSSRRPLPAGVA